MLRCARICQMSYILNFALSMQACRQVLNCWYRVTYQSCIPASAQLLVTIHLSILRTPESANTVHQPVVITSTFQSFVGNGPNPGYHQLELY